VTLGTGVFVAPRVLVGLGVSVAEGMLVGVGVGSLSAKATDAVLRATPAINAASTVTIGLICKAFLLAHAGPRYFRPAGLAWTQ
jgi:hypothetical protein